MMSTEEAKKRLDLVLKQTRLHSARPIQIAEILYRDRIKGDIDLEELDSYRMGSRKWVDAVYMELFGQRVATPQLLREEMFGENALLQGVFAELGKENRRTNGMVEAYIYKGYIVKHRRLAQEFLSYDFIPELLKERHYEALKGEGLWALDNV